MATISRTIILRNESNAQSLWSLLKANWRQMADAGKPLAISVAEHKSKRSVEQNKRLHALLTTISECAFVAGRQYDMEAWKEYYRKRYIGTEEIDMPDGTRLERGISTTTLDVEEFSRFMTSVEAHAVQELGIEFTV